MVEWNRLSVESEESYEDSDYHVEQKAKKTKRKKKVLLKFLCGTSQDTSDERVNKKEKKGKEGKENKPLREKTPPPSAAKVLPATRIAVCTVVLGA